ncbi:uncharacterized protein [Excalfactoria chinensis]|uniref:uncharacterized protein isoform X4 n=1 Tax=Excalfactoria chinensis TaxID=46218 RepID=UPI003B3B6021
MNTFRGRGGGVGVVARVPRGTRKRGERRGAGLERPVHVTGDREEREASGARLQLRGLEDCRVKTIGAAFGKREKDGRQNYRFSLSRQVVESCGPGILKLGPQHSQWNNHHKATEAREPNSRIFSFTSARERNSRIFSFTSRSVAEHRLRQGGRRGAGERAVRREGRPRESPSG